MSQGRLLAWWHKYAGTADAVRVDQRPVGELAIDPWVNPDRAIAFGHRIVFFGVFALLAWAALAPLDEGVTASGVISVESRRKAIAPLTNGLVASIAVTENQRVKAGDVLLTLENTQAQSAYDSAVQEHFAKMAKLARLEAEEVKATYLQLPKELEDLDQEPWAREIIAAEVRLLNSRVGTLENELAILRERVAAGDARLRGARQQLTSRQQQYALLSEQVSGMEKLVDAGHTPRNQLLEAQRSLVEIGRQISELESTIAVNTNATTELRLLQTQRHKEYQRDLEAQIVDTRREVAQLGEKLKATKNEVERTVIKAPTDGQIVSLQGLASGSAVMLGMHLMDLIPEGDRLLIDVQVPTHLIDRVQVGLASSVRVNAFPDEPQLIIPGQIVSVSADQLPGQAAGQAYYLARIEVTTEGLQQLGHRKLRPGMPVDAIIKTGERSLLAYLVNPLMRRVYFAFREH